MVKKGETYSRRLPVSLDELRSDVKKLNAIAAEYTSFIEDVDRVEFAGELWIDGARNIGEAISSLRVSIARLNKELNSELAKQRYPRMHRSVPDSIPDSAPNTRDNAAKKRKLSNGRRGGKARNTEK